MTRRKKILWGFIIVFAILTIGVFIFVKILSNKGLPDYNADIKLKGLKGKVEVLRDKYGVAHVYAENQTDLYRAVGYLQAQDRFWQMDLLRRITLGRLSEIFGQDMVDADKLFRSLRISKKSKEILKECSPELISVLNAFTDGINQYLEKDELSFEFTLLGYKPEKWQPFHTVNLIGYMAWDLNTAWNSELIYFKLQQKLDKLKFDELINSMNRSPVIYGNFNLDGIPDDSSLTASLNKVPDIVSPVFSGSNNWVISGKRSKTGKPILCNDMHLGIMAPGVWTQMHHIVKGELNVTGVALPGQPFIIVGHNADIAWGMTNVMLDGMDFYMETINPENPNMYKFNGEWKNFELINEKIAVKGGDTIDYTVRLSHRGPVISEIKGIKEKVISAHWLGNDKSNEMRTIFLLNRAKNWDDFKNAVKTFVSVAQNINYADIEGNIGLYCCAGVPKRSKPGWMVFPGDTDEYDWKGFVPFDSLPHFYNPAKGFLVSANNRTADKNYPYYISNWFAPPARFNRITEMLQAKEKLGVEDMKVIQTNQYSNMAKDLVPKILAITKEVEKNEQIKELVQILADWDYEMSADKTAPLIFEEFYLILARNLMADEMGEQLYYEYLGNSRLINFMMEYIIKNQKSKWCDNVNTPEKQETMEDIVKLSFENTVDSIKNKYGKNFKAQKWGDVHCVNIEHPLGKVPILNFLFGLNYKKPVGGSYHTVNPYAYSFRKPFEAKKGASQRHIFSLGDYDQSKVAIPTGVSGIPGSKHYLDQAEDYKQGIYHDDAFTRKAVEDKAVYRMEFLPQSR